MSRPTSPGLDAAPLLGELERGEGRAAARLAPILYAQLRVVASRALRGERRTVSLQTTDVLHEAYLRLAGQRLTRVEEAPHFLALAGQAVRRVLVDHARRRAALKRGEGERRVTLHGTDLAAPDGVVDVLALNEAIEELATLDERGARVVELRYFAGLSIEETARVLGLSPGTIKDDWVMARAFLRRRLEPG